LRADLQTNPPAGDEASLARARLERAQLALVAASGAGCFVSIFAAEAFLALAVALHLARLAMGHARFARLPLDGPILALSVWTLLSASFSPDPLRSFEEAKELVLFAALYVAVDCLTSAERRERFLAAVLLGGLALGTGSLVQYYFLGFDTLQSRPLGFLGHYMTASGLSMGVLLLAATRLVFGKVRLERPANADLWVLCALGTGLALLLLLQGVGSLAAKDGRLLVVVAVSGCSLYVAVSKGPWPSPTTSVTLAVLAVPISAWALLISRTRSAWLGSLAGLAVLAALKAPRSVWLLPAGIVALLALRPTTVIDRLTITDASSRDRYYMWQAGIDMIRDKPVFGQGPGMIQGVYPKYRWPEAPNPQTPHLHDNALQIAAERGLPCLAWWLWWAAAAMGDAYRESRRAKTAAGWSAAGALVVLSAMMVAGLFEYNFGDSEILMFIMMASALPYALRREQNNGWPTRSAASAT